MKKKQKINRQKVNIDQLSAFVKDNFKIILNKIDNLGYYLSHRTNEVDSRDYFVSIIILILFIFIVSFNLGQFYIEKQFIKSIEAASIVSCSDGSCVILFPDKEEYSVKCNSDYDCVMVGKTEEIRERDANWKKILERTMNGEDFLEILKETKQLDQSGVF